ncbi:hypothetical protein DFQ28_003985 [Apophysomyces sp. BC1034]|nr:hypothetical protein DFQ30_002420 [Apophysomyces sp. BC1015]KAG0189039.1 hypothetical protein DFQ28_003985 [Apophysomyces sp. BC1034]
MGFEQLAALKQQLAAQARQQRAEQDKQQRAQQGRPPRAQQSEPRHAKPDQAGQPGRRPAHWPAEKSRPVDPVVETIRRLQKHFPQAFPRKPQPKRPLKLGIHTDAMQHADKLGLTEAQIKDAIATWCQGSRYWGCLVEHAARVDLQGNPVGEVSAPQVARARWLASRRTRPRGGAKRERVDAKTDAGHASDGARATPEFINPSPSSTIPTLRGPSSPSDLGSTSSTESGHRLRRMPPELLQLIALKLPPKDRIVLAEASPNGVAPAIAQEFLASKVIINEVPRVSTRAECEEVLRSIQGFRLSLRGEVLAALAERNSQLPNTEEKSAVFDSILAATQKLPDALQFALLTALARQINSLPDNERAAAFKSVFDATQKLSGELQSALLTALADEIDSLPDNERAAAFRSVFDATQKPSGELQSVLLTALAGQIRRFPGNEWAAAFRRVSDAIQKLSGKL